MDSTFNANEAQFYKKPGKAFAPHEAVNHGDGEYARGETTTTWLKATSAFSSAECVACITIAANSTCRRI